MSIQLTDFERYQKRINYVNSSEDEDWEQKPGREKDSNVGVIDRPEVKKQIKTEIPKMWNVWLLNDNITPFHVVIIVVIVVFNLSEDEASRHVIIAHKTGRAHMGAFTRDVAETKAQQVSTECRKHGEYPLRADIDEAPSP